MGRRRDPSFWFGIAIGVLVLLVGVALVIWRDDILEALLDPEIPYAVYRPPPAPDYGRASSWALLPTPPAPGDPGFDVFFVHPTTFDGGHDWNGPISDRRAHTLFTQVVEPNYAAPFASVGRMFAPRYRQASLYTSLTLFDDAIEAREFAYRDVLAAFRAFSDRLSAGRPFILVGVEQGGVLAARLASAEIAPNAALRKRLVAVYLIDAPVPADEHLAGSPAPACRARDQAGCIVAWMSVGRGDFPRALRIADRARVWNTRGRLVGLGGRPMLCVNPLTGAADDAFAPARLNLGAANATGLEWGARPGFMARQVGAGCEGGLLRFTKPRSASLRPAGGWAERLRAPPYNLFWADLEADARARAAAYTHGHVIQKE